MEILLTHDVHAGGRWCFISYGHDVLCHYFFDFHCFGRTIAEDDLVREVSLRNNPCELGLIIGDDECSDIARYHLFYCFINAAFCVD